MSLVNYGPAGLGPISQATLSTFNAGAYNSGTQSFVVDTLGYSGVYKGRVVAVLVEDEVDETAHAGRQQALAN